jgi:hypothetical protein
MQLTAEWFDQIVKSLRSDERNSSRHGLRKEGRVGVRCSVDVIPRVFSDDGETVVRVKIRDISHSGIGFTSRVKMTLGHEMICRLPGDNNSTVEVPMTIRHCNRLAKGLFSIGAKFNGPPLPAGAADKRAYDVLDATANSI